MCANNHSMVNDTIDNFSNFRRKSVGPNIY